MGYIKEPYGIDFVVDPTPLSVADRAMISEVIRYYKTTGRKKTFLAKNKRASRKSIPVKS